MSYAVEYGNHQQTFKMESTIVINNENTNILVPGQKVKVLHKCDHCDACSPQKGIIKRHIGLVHERKNPLECMECYAVFVEQKQLSKHKRKQHSNSMPFQCGVCKAGFTEKGAVNRHIANVHEGKRSHVCEICQKTFTERGIMDRHIKYVHEKIKDYKCPYCVKEFGGRGNLNIHVRTVHEGVKPHKCPVCQVGYVDKRAMQRHVDTVHRGIIQKDYEKFQCSQCESKFSTKYTLKAHVESIHDNIRPLECSLCDKTYPARGGKQALENHFQRVHQGISNDGKAKVTAEARTFVKTIFNTDMNPLITASPSKINIDDLRDKLATETVNRMQVEVDEFGKPLFQPEEMLDKKQVKNLFHKFTYNEKIKGVKPFSCDLCDKPFAKKSILLGHMKNVHEESKVEIPEKAKDYVRNILSQRPLTETTGYRNQIALDIKSKMEVEVDQFGKPIFQPDEVLSEAQIKCLVARFQQENKTIECNICQKKFTKQSNLSYHFKMQHSEHENIITPQTRSFVKGIFDLVTITGRAHRKDVAQEIVARMKNDIDPESGEPLFKSNEMLDMTQIDSMLFNLMQAENKKKRKDGHLKNLDNLAKSKVNIKMEDIDDMEINREHIKSVEESIAMAVDNAVSEMRHLEHPIMLGDVVICDLVSSIMNSKVNEPSPLVNYENKTIISIAEMAGSQVLDKDLSARNRKKEAKFREIENAIVTYVTQNCSCYQHM